MDIRVSAVGAVDLEEARQRPMNGGADKVATCSVENDNTTSRGKRTQALDPATRKM